MLINTLRLCYTSIYCLHLTWLTNTQHSIFYFQNILFIRRSVHLDTWQLLQKLYDIFSIKYGFRNTVFFF